MADEIMEAIQMLRFGYDGIKLGLDVTGFSIREAKNLTIFIVGLLNHEKTQGKTSLKKMLKNSGNLQVLQIKEKDDIIYGTGKDRIQAFWLDVDG